MQRGNQDERESGQDGEGGKTQLVATRALAGHAHHHALEAAYLCAGDDETVARVCGTDPDRIGRFYRLFAGATRVVTAFSQGVNQSSAGTDKVNSIINWLQLRLVSAGNPRSDQVKPRHLTPDIRRLSTGVSSNITRPPMAPSQKISRNRAGSDSMWLAS
jgi:hypothetical protein